MAEIIGLGAGGGGSEQRDLIEQVRKRLSNPLLDSLEDSALLPDALAEPGAQLVFTTDSYVVHPWRFPGGDVGKLAVCGTVNDLAVMGARPRYLSAGMIVEEGTAQAELLAAVDSMARAAKEAGVRIVTGDTKVVERGKGDGIFINTAGIGIKPAGRNYGAHRLVPGLALIASGNLGDHSVAVMLSREGMEFESDIVSDCAPLGGMVEALIEAVGADSVYAMRDLTRGGLAAVLNEYAEAGGLDMLIEEAALPVLLAVQAAARVLGFEPSVLANEGKLLAVVAQDRAETAVAALRGHRYGRDAALIGVTGPRFDTDKPVADRPRRPLVLYTTPSGGRRVVEMPLGELLPRIC